MTRVSGRLSPTARRRLQHQVAEPIARYFDDAFLSGSYPRSDFGSAFASFPPSLAHQALADRMMLSNARYGPTTTEVEPVKEAAYLSVLAPHKVAAGVSAHIEFVLIDHRGPQTAKRVTLTGRLSLTRTASGGWKIFAYQLAGSAADDQGAS